MERLRRAVGKAVMANLAGGVMVRPDLVTTGAGWREGEIGLVGAAAEGVLLVARGGEGGGIGMEAVE